MENSSTTASLVSGDAVASGSVTAGTGAGTSTSNQMEALVTRYYYHQELDKAHDQMKREEHEKRIKGLRKELDWIVSTQWMYPSVDKLIGQ